MKKVLSIVLSLVMVLCMMPAMAFAGTDAAYTDIAGETCENAVTTLSNLGVVDGYPDGSYKPEVAVKRAEAAKLIIAALGLTEEATGTKASFTDLAGYEWAEGYIGYAESLGILKGDGNGLYRPADVVSYNEMAAIVIRALGYTDDALQGEFPAAHVAQAKALGAFADVVSGGSTGADRGDCAIMIFNVLGKQIGTTDKDGKWDEKQVSDTMIERLGAKAYKTGVVTLADARNADVDLYDYVGAQATLYTDKDGDVIAIADVESTFLTGKLSSDKKTFEADGVKYVVKDGAIAGHLVKTKNYETTADLLDTTSTVTYKAAVKVSGKTITHVYSMNKWVATAVDQIESAHLRALDKNDTLLGKSFIMDDNQEIDTTTFDLAGVDSLADIKVDDIVSVYVAGSEVVKVEVSDATVTGKVTKVAADNDVTINGVEYPVHSAISLGEEGTFYLDYSGKIFTSKTESKIQHAHVVKAMDVEASSAYDGESALKVKLLTTSGEKKIFTVEKEYAKTIDKASFPAGASVEYEINNDGEITLIQTYGLTKATGTYITAGYIDGKQIADDVMVVIPDAADGTYKLGSLANIPADTALNSTWYHIEKGEVVVIECNDITADTVLGFVAAVATVEDADGNSVQEVTLVDGSVYTVKKGTTLTLDKETLYEFALAAGKITGKTNKVATKSGVVVDLDTAAISTKANAAANDNTAVFELVNSDVKVYKYVKDINDNFKSLEVIDLASIATDDVVDMYDTNTDKGHEGYEFIIVK